MSAKLDAIFIDSGTRFRIFPQPSLLTAFSESETIWVNLPSHAMQLGTPHHAFQY